MTNEEILTAVEIAIENGGGKTSPTAVCETLARLGYAAVTGPVYREKPVKAVFERVCDTVARSTTYTYAVRGNTRVIGKVAA